MASTTNGQLAVQAINLTRTYGTPPSMVEALRGVSAEIEQGERVALLGKSGSGKSTLLNMIAALDRPSEGSIVVCGQDLSTVTAAQAAQHRLTTVGMVFQSFNLIASRTALQNVELPMVFAGRSPKDRREASRRSLERVGLANRQNHRPGELSGGEQQRVAIARALANEPKILLADEPTGNLDTSTSEEIIQLLLDHVQSHGTTFILVTHDEQLAARCAKRVLRLQDGRLIDEEAATQGRMKNNK